ncbi:hypothetical protein TNCV_4544151 [Trichonephila clavipes]|nr:hypothetical protein TNCV_4544151 [Trichonephila clavipes]
MLPNTLIETGAYLSEGSVSVSWISGNPFVTELTEKEKDATSNRMVKLPMHPTEPWITFTQSLLLTRAVSRGHSDLGP